MEFGVHGRSQDLVNTEDRNPRSERNPKVEVRSARSLTVGALIPSPIGWERVRVRACREKLFPRCLTTIIPSPRPSPVRRERGIVPDAHLLPCFEISDFELLSDLGFRVSDFLIIHPLQHPIAVRLAQAIEFSFVRFHVPLMAQPAAFIPPGAGS